MGIDENDEPVIYVVGPEDEEGEEDRWRGRRADIEVTRAPVSTKHLRSQITAFVGQLNEIMAALPESIGSLELDSVTISAEISAKGTLSLMGIGGAEVAGKGGIAFTLRRPTT